MARKAILTPVLRYWGFGKHPFDDYVLSGMDLRLFVDRSRELRKLRDALSSRLTGTVGVLCVG